MAEIKRNDVSPERKERAERLQERISELADEADNHESDLKQSGDAKSPRDFIRERMREFDDHAGPKE